MFDFWLSPIKEDLCEEEEMTILDYNNEFKQSQTKEDLVKFSSIVKQEDFLLNQELLALNGKNILVRVLGASKFFYSAKQEYMRFFFEGFVLAFFEEEPEYKSHIKRKLKIKDVHQMDKLAADKVRLNFGEKDFIEFRVLEESRVSQSLEELDDSNAPSETELSPEAVVGLLGSLFEFLDNVSRSPATRMSTVQSGGSQLATEESKGTQPKESQRSKEKLKSLLKIRTEINSVTNLDKRQSAMYMNRHSREELMEAVGKSKLSSIEEEDPAQMQEKVKFVRARDVLGALQVVEKDFLELDLLIHEQLEDENAILQEKTRKAKKKFLKATKHLQKVLSYGKSDEIRWSGS